MKKAIIFFILWSSIIGMSAQNISDVEYFFDVDPGVGNGIPISISPDEQITGTASVSLSSLSPGFHAFYIRGKQEGLWGQYGPRRTFYLGTVSQPDFSEEITSAEYFFDADPGIGNGQTISIVPGNEQAVTFNAPLDDLESGFHSLYVRTEQNGIWSQYGVKRSFFISTIDAGADNGEITAAEYYFDVDPGVGNGEVIPLSANTFIDLTVFASIDLLDIGFHSLYIRTKQNGVWGHYGTKRTFYLDETAVVAFSPISAIEVFVDQDPGIGNGQLLDVANSYSVEGMINLASTGLSAGTHLLYIRAITESGNVSQYITRPFSICEGGEISPNITSTIIPACEDGEFSVELEMPDDWVGPDYTIGNNVNAQTAVLNAGQSFIFGPFDSAIEVSFNALAAADDSYCPAVLEATYSCFDCEDNDVNNGDPCVVGENPGEYVDCECETYEPDCAGVLNGTSEVDDCGECLEGGSLNPFWNTSCEDCEGEPNGLAVAGTPCDDGDENTVNDLYQEDCTCAGQSLNVIAVTNLAWTGSNGIPSCQEAVTILNGVEVPGIWGDENPGEVSRELFYDEANSGEYFISYQVDDDLTLTINGESVITDNDNAPNTVLDFPITEYLVDGTNALEATLENEAACYSFFALIYELDGNTQIVDCNGVLNGGAQIDACGICSGGNTGFVPNASCTDCEGVINGAAVEDSPCESDGMAGTWTSDCECLVPLVDFTVMNVNTSASVVTPGSDVELNWEISNIGSQSTILQWEERIYIQPFGGSGLIQVDQLLFDEEGIFDANQTEFRSAMVSLPQNITFGDQGVFVVEIIPNASVPEVEDGQANNIGTETSPWDVQKELQLSLSANEIIEGGVGIEVNVSRSGDVSGPLEFTFDIESPELFSFPENFQIAAGDFSTVFTITALDNETPEFDQVVELAVNASGYVGSISNLQLINDDDPMLAISGIDPVVMEGELVSFEVSVDLISVNPIEVFLSSTSPTRFPVPSSVEIPGGEPGVVVELLLPANDIPQLATNVTVNAAANGFGPGISTFVVDDDDMPAFELTVEPDTISEGGEFYAAIGHISRVPGSNTIGVAISLSSTDTDVLYLPEGVNLQADEDEVSFNIGLIDDEDVNGFRTIQISGAAILPSCNCTVDETSSAYSMDSLVVADNDGPALTAELATPTLAEGLGLAGYLRVYRNTALDEILNINLQSSNTNEAILPSSATIQLNQAYVDIPIETVNDGEIDGSVQVYFTASADGFAPGIVSATVTDINKPDLSISSVVLSEQTVSAFAMFNYAVGIVNTGLATAPSGVVVRGYLSENNLLDNQDILISEDTIVNPILQGDSALVLNITSAPNLPGMYNLIFVVNQNADIIELIHTNNRSSGRDFEIQPDYTATVSVPETYYTKGTSIPISGSAVYNSGDPAANVPIEVWVLNGDFRREVFTFSDDLGNFEAVFHPLPNEADHYEIGAGFPGLESTSIDDSFDILGVRINQGQVPELLVVFGEDPISGSVEITNQCSITLNDFTLAPMSIPNGAQIIFDPIESLEGFASMSLNYQVSGEVQSQGLNYEVATYDATCDLGSIQEQAVFYYCQNAGGALVSSIEEINTSASTSGASAIIQFEISNIGQGNTGVIEIELPEVSWLSAISPATISDLAPGDTAIVILEFEANGDIPFDFPVNGSIALNADNASSLTIPFQFEKVSDSNGSFLVEVVNQFTYFDEAEPKVEGAFVEVKNYYTGDVYAEGYSDENGLFDAGEIPEGVKLVTVTKEQHLPYQGTTIINPGQENNLNVFLNYQAVTFTWDVVPTTIEDVYDITLITLFETNVPIPVVTVEAPSSMPQLEEGEEFAFNVILTNHGLITANDVELFLPQDDPVYEFVTPYEPSDILAIQSIVVPVVMKLRDTDIEQEGPITSDQTIGDISQFLGMDESNYISVSSTALNCQDFIGISFTYPCGGEALTQLGGTMFHYEFRICTSEGDPTDPGQGGYTYYGPGGGSGGPLTGGPGGVYDPPCVSCPPGGPGISFGGIPPFISLNSIGCQERLNTIIDIVENCFPASKAASTFVKIAKPVSCALFAEEFVDLVKCLPLPDPLKEALDAAEPPASLTCFAETECAAAYAQCVADDAASTIIDDVVEAVSEEVPVVSCIVALIKAYDQAFNLGPADEPEPDPCAGTNGIQQNNDIEELELEPDLPLELVQPFQNLLMSRDIYLTRSLWAHEYYGDIVYKESLEDLLMGIQLQMVLNQTIEQSVQDSLLIAFAGSDISQSELQGFFDRWNTSMEFWSEDVYTDEEAGQDIIDFHKVESYKAIIQEAMESMEAQGFETVFDMLLDVKQKSGEYASQEAQGVCSAVTIEISQTLTMTREAFEGTFTMYNGHPSNLLDSLTINIEIKDENGVNRNDLFEIQNTTLVNLSDISGTGSLPAEENGLAEFIFIPEIGAAPTVPVQYGFGGSVSYKDPYSGVMVTLPFNPITLTVNPSPQLDLHYFLERNVLGDDALTDPIEPSIPGQLAVMVDNKGYGTAINLSISSAQPELVDNENGLALDFSLIGSNLQGLPAQLGVNNIAFGNIPPHSAKIGQWYYLSSLLGKFVAYEANVVHANSFGNPELSLITGITLHELTRAMRQYGPDDDEIQDFLVNDIADLNNKPDKIYFSQGNSTAEVCNTSEASFSNLVSAPSFTNSLTIEPDSAGWNYVLLDDPGQGLYELISITRDDGQEIPMDNGWLSYVTLQTSQEPIYEDKFHFVDWFEALEPQSYEVVWSPKETDILQVVSIEGAPEGVSSQPVQNLIVSFSKPVAAETFDFEDLTLNIQGSPNVADASIIITQLDPQTFDVDISALSVLNGFHLFTVQAAGIEDLTGTSGETGIQVSWNQYLTIPAVQDFIGIPEEGTNVAVDSVDIVFNLSVVPESIVPNIFTTLKDGENVEHALSVIPISEDDKTYRIYGFGDVVSTSGIYTLEVDLSQVESSEGEFGIGSQSKSYEFDNQGPDVIWFQLLDEGGLDSQHRVFAEFKLDEYSPFISTSAITLMRSGLEIPLLANQLEYFPVDSIWRIGNFGMDTYFEGPYSLSLNKGMIEDVFDNPGVGEANIEWVVDRSFTLELSNLQINPDFGFSDNDGVSYSSTFDVMFEMDQATALVEIYQVNLGSEFLLQTIENAPAGLNQVGVNLVSNGSTAIKVVASNENGASVEISRSIYIDETPLDAFIAMQEGLVLSTQIDSILFYFSEALLSDANLIDHLYLKRNQLSLSIDDLEIVNVEDSLYRLSGIADLFALEGLYEFGIDLSGLNEYRSGISGLGERSILWNVEVPNQAPISEAGDIIMVNSPGTYFLDGTSSADPDGDELTFAWLSFNGPALSDTTMSSPSFEITEADDGAIYTYTLLVSDGNAFDTDAVQVFVNLVDEFDCPDLEVNNGDPCVNEGQVGTYIDCACVVFDCLGVPNGLAYEDECGVCDDIPENDNSTCTDCAGVINGSASIDDCGICSGGDTGLVPNESCTDCEGVVNGDAQTGDLCFIDDQAGIYDSECNCALFPLATINAVVEWNMECGTRNVSVSLYNIDYPLLNSIVETSLDELGDFALPTVPAGNYHIYISVEGFLSVLMSDVVIDEGANQLSIPTLIYGDLDGSNGVNIEDVSIISASFGYKMGHEDYNPLADLNCDGVVNIVDASILNVTFGLVGDSPPFE